MNRRRQIQLFSLSLLLGFSGCAIFSKGEVTSRRYFSPDLPLATAKVGAKRSGVELRLGRVSAGTYIGDKIVYRESNYEVGYYDERLWTEKPDAYLRRALTRKLFEEEGLRNVVSGAAPTLDVELISFEEVRAPEHIALVRIAMSLHDDRVNLMQRTIAVQRPIAVTPKAGEADAVAQGLGEALRAAVDDVTTQVLARLATPNTAPVPCPDPGAKPNGA